MSFVSPSPQPLSPAFVLISLLLSLTVSLPLSQSLSLSLSEIYIQIHFASLNLDLQEENVVARKFMLKRSKVDLSWDRPNPRSHLSEAWPQKLILSKWMDAMKAIKASFLVNKLSKLSLSRLLKMKKKYLTEVDLILWMFFFGHVQHSVFSSQS